MPRPAEDAKATQEAPSGAQPTVQAGVTPTSTFPAAFLAGGGGGGALPTATQAGGGVHPHSAPLDAEAGMEPLPSATELIPDFLAATRAEQEGTALPVQGGGSGPAATRADPPGSELAAKCAAPPHSVPESGLAATGAVPLRPELVLGPALPVPRGATPDGATLPPTLPVAPPGPAAEGGTGALPYPLQ